MSVDQQKDYYIPLNSHIIYHQNIFRAVKVSYEVQEYLIIRKEKIMSQTTFPSYVKLQTAVLSTKV